MNTSCSLEHCHTNLFALQSLNDMKWKCFRRSLQHRLENNQLGRLDNYKDPVLIAYWKALHADILCAWRRVPSDDGQKIERELWLFGINEDLPSNFTDLRSITDANTSWKDTAMSYDCRIMLFKALHNMIEKYLLSKGFARLNKWFVLPINDHSDVKVPNYSFNFNFFLHGDNKVCASVDVQRHKHIFNLTNKDLERTSPTNVILAPYGINGMLIGLVSREIDMNLLRDNWEKNYPIRHLDNLPDFVEVTIGNARMFYPTCYVYKIGTNDETISMNKKSDISTTKKTKPSTIINTSLDSTINTNKFDNSLIKNFANNLLISAQRNNCIDLDKRQDNKQNELCSIINDPINQHLCRCNQCLPTNTRSTPFIPFHRRQRTTPPTNVSDPSIRNKIESNKNENSSDSNENQDILIESTSSPILTLNNQPTTNEKPIDWNASTPSSVGIIAPSSMTNINSVPTNSPIPNPPSARGVKRSATIAFDDTTIVEDDEREQHKQTYDFYRTDSFLQLPLKRFRPDDHLNSHRIQSITTTPEHVYQHGQPTPPSPSHIPLRNTFDFDDNEDSTSRTSYPPSTPTTTTTTTANTSTTIQHISSFYPTDGPSMADLETIMDPHDTTENKNSNPTTISDHNVKSPNRKENTLLPPPPPIPIISINNTTTYSLNKSFNGVFHHEIEQIYNTPPGSSSSEKLQVLHSPYAIIAETASHVANTFDTLNQFSQEIILAPFESVIVTEQSSYYPINKISLKKSDKRYEPSKNSLSTITSNHQKPFRHWKHTISMNDISSSPFNNQQILRQQPTPRSMPTPTLYSPMRSNDIQSSPYLNRSIGSVQTINSPLGGNLSSLIPEIDSLILNVLLNDSILNIYRDINFDSCVLCACTSNELSIHGNDSIIYLEKSRDHNKSTTHSHNYSHHDQQSMNNSCSCGFSAVVNLRLSSSSGLFYEDEIEITGIKTDVKYRQTNEQLTINLLELIEKKESLSSPFDYFNNYQTIQKKNLQ